VDDTSYCLRDCLGGLHHAGVASLWGPVCACWMSRAEAARQRRLAPEAVLRMQAGPPSRPWQRLVGSALSLCLVPFAGAAAAGSRNGSAHPAAAASETRTAPQGVTATGREGASATLSAAAAAPPEAGAGERFSVCCCLLAVLTLAALRQKMGRGSHTAPPHSMSVFWFACGLPSLQLRACVDFCHPPRQRSVETDNRD